MTVLIIAALNVNSIRGCYIFSLLSSIVLAFYLYVVRNGEVNGLFGGSIIEAQGQFVWLLFGEKTSWSLHCPYMTVVTSVNHYTQLNRNFFLLASTQKQVLLLNKKCTMQKDVSRKKVCLHSICTNEIFLWFFDQNILENPHYCPKERFIFVFSLQKL